MYGRQLCHVCAARTLRVCRVVVCNEKTTLISAWRETTKGQRGRRKWVGGESEYTGRGGKLQDEAVLYRPGQRYRSYRNFLETATATTKVADFFLFFIFYFTLLLLFFATFLCLESVIEEVAFSVYSTNLAGSRSLLGRERTATRLIRHFQARELRATT